MSKPTGAICNLGCSYCYFLDKEALYPGDRFRMPDEVAEAYVSQMIEATRGPEVTITWQGGEPTLMGVDFFRRVVEMEEHHRRDGQTVRNALQTNGTLLTDEWCELLAAHDFLVGLSLDGPRRLHDAHRVNKRGGGTFDDVMAGLRLLQRHGVDVNILTTVNRVNGAHPLETYRFLRDDAGAEWIQFIPIVERLDEHGRPAELSGTKVSERSVGAEQFGEFLVTVFDEWVRHDVGEVFVQTFEAAVATWSGLPAGLCVFEETCGRGLALEHNGDLYSCDHFVDPDHRLGNIVDTQIVELVAKPAQRDFGTAKRDELPQYCRECDVRFACHGECPKNRFITTPDGEGGLNYLCAGYKRFFGHIDEPMRRIVDLLRSRRQPTEIMAIAEREGLTFADVVRRAGRNDPCPCGSGRKTKRCHGAGAPAAPGPAGAEPVPVTLGRPRPRVRAAAGEPPGPAPTTG
ncbi:MAG: anaerobic sulfatase maturase [Actinomycetota bacterium]|nr:anaerobic sulfatase maturase [Actinomycetota bacterium]